MTCFNPIHAWQRTNYPIGKYAEKLKIPLKELNKLSFKYKEGWKQIKLPCGKCLGCLLDRANMWSLRVMLEAEQWKNNCFITLTYNDKGVRKNGERQLPIGRYGHSTLRQKDVQNFLKRLRKEFHGIEKWKNPITGKKEYPIRYFYCGEYGENGSKRPHYHIAIMNWMPNDLKFYKPSKKTGKALYTSKTIERLWGHGFAPIGTLTYESACYIARYIQKKAYGKKILEPDQEKEFIQMSRMPGIGAKQWYENQEKYKKNGNIIIYQNGLKIKPIPRYFMKLWEKSDMSEYDTFKYHQQQKIEERQKDLNKIIEKYGKPSDHISGKTLLYYNKLEETVKDKTKVLKRNL